MRRPSNITLALMGGGAAMAALGGIALVGSRGESEACRQARLENRPDTAQVCASGRAGGSYSYGFSSDGRGSSSSGGDSASATSRGGFGTAGRVSS